MLAEAAEAESRAPFDVAVDLICCDVGRTGLTMFQQDGDDLDRVLRHRLHMVGSDSLPRPGGKPHPRGAGTFARVLHAAIRQGGDRSLEDTVRKMTSLPAQRFGLWDRGILRPGLAADLVVFANDVTDLATYDDPRTAPVGICSVLVNGIPVVSDGQSTGARPGRVLGAETARSPTSPTFQESRS